MIANHQVALTIFDPSEVKTIQLEGQAHIEGDLEIKSLIFLSLFCHVNTKASILCRQLRS